MPPPSERCPVCGVRPANGLTCGHPMCAAAAIWRGLACTSRSPRAQARNEARAIDTERRALAIALVERRRVS